MARGLDAYVASLPGLDIGCSLGPSLYGLSSFSGLAQASIYGDQSMRAEGIRVFSGIRFKTHTVLLLPYLWARARCEASLDSRCRERLHLLMGKAAKCGCVFESFTSRRYLSSFRLL